MLRKSIVLSGPPGAGKSTLGRKVAEKLNLTAVDLDDVIAANEGQSPADLIRSRGEPAFRSIEKAALDALPDEALVVSLGGGTLTSPPARRSARSLGTIVGLSADESVLAARLAEGGDRPLLAKGLRPLLDERARSYRSVDRVVDATHLEPAAGAIVEAAQAIDVVEARFGSARSRIVIGEGVPEAAAGAVASLDPKRPVLAILDEGVPVEAREAYVAAIRRIAPVVVAQVPGGESVKTWTSVGALLERAIEGGCGRQSAVVGLGGGATCDAAALTASLLGRGAPVVLVPSTLLAQVDASVGGKTAANVGGRNTVGTFHAASDVVIDVALTRSQDERAVRSGLAEMLKVGIIADPILFDTVIRDRRADRATVLASVLRKAEIVAQDPSEHGLRKVLNLGHTLGHALEAASDFQMLHGEAVAIGIAAMARFSAERGWLGEGEKARIVHGFERVGLPTTAPRGLLERAATHISQDKKGTANEVELVCIHRVGKVAAERLPWSVAQVDLVRNGGIE